jgi:predicted  nucleic acid-binding Zn-ribbon protein
MSNYEKVRAECLTQPGFEEGTAYARTKVCCRILMQHGQSIPSWTVIRDIIGKGSSTDISRATKDFRQEHAERLRRLDGALPGIPEHLAPLVSSLWEAAFAAARTEFDAKERQWQIQIDQAEARSEMAAQQLVSAEVAMERQRDQIGALDSKIATLESLVRTEQASRQQAERMFEQHSADVSAQRDKLEEALSKNQVEMKKALERFDGERRHAMLQIDEARTKAANEVASVRAQAQREKSGLELEMARLHATVADLRNKANEADRKAAVTGQELIGLRERLSRAEADNDRLSSDNRRMVSLLKKHGTVVNTKLRLKRTSLIAGNTKKRG